jgi:hypothetical protein
MNNRDPLDRNANLGTRLGRDERDVDPAAAWRELDGVDK